MEGILLGALSYYGKNNSIKTQQVNNMNTYDTNIENQMNNIETRQANNLKKSPEFFRQFDSLTFDNLSKPTAENQAYTTRSGFNTFLQRDIEFQNGYSEFQDTDMHYGVVTREHFTHNNMFPNTSRRETMINLNSNSRKYENLSGNSNEWKHKHEIETFFDPVKDMTNVNGMPVVADQLSNRYIASLKNNNGALPFQTDVKVRPGLDGKISAPYAVHRIDPRNVDALRSETNRKVTYYNKPLETIKKGDIRGYESNITKYKLPSYRNVEFADLVANKANVERNKVTGDFVHIDTERGVTETDYYGPLNDYNRGKIKDVSEIIFTEPKKENYENDFTHAINAVNTRPVFQNAESYTNYETERDTELSEMLATGVYNNNQASYYKDNNNIAKTTMKENNIVQDRNLGINGPGEYKTYMFSNDSVLPITNRQITNYDDVTNAAPAYQSTHVQYTDVAKSTIRETINFDDVLNAAPSYQNTNLLYTDTAKSTIRETINHEDVLNAAPTYQNTHVQYSDQAKQTIRETINFDDILNAAPSYQNTHVQYTDPAKSTIRETTNYDDILNAAPSYQNTHVQYTDAAKMTIKETTGNNPFNLISKPEGGNPYTGLNDQARMTIKETTVINSIISNAAPTYQNTNLLYTDQAKETIRQTTNFNDVLNSAPTYQNTHVQYTDQAKETIKETTIDNNYIGIHGGDNNKETYSNYEDTAKATIRQTTLTETPVQNIVANVTQAYVNNDDIARTTIKETTLHEQQNSGMYDSNQGYYNINDDARPTIKQTTLITNYTGQTNTNVNALRVEDAERNMTINDKRQQTALGGRIGNAKSDKIRGDINKETLEHKNKRKLFGYVSNPGKGKDYAVTPLNENRVNRKTDITEGNNYRIDTIFIDTLNDNPLVNDLMHQKNIDFNTGK
jgi:hypothetical protein